MHTYMHTYISLFTLIWLQQFLYLNTVFEQFQPPPLPSSTHILPLQGPEFDPHGLSLSLVFTEFLIHLKNKKMIIKHSILSIELSDISGGGGVTYAQMMHCLQDVLICN